MNIKSGFTKDFILDMEVENMKKKIYEIVLAALATAIIFVATIMIKIPNGIDGYFNLGDGMILLFSPLLTPVGAIVASGVGSGLADIFGGYSHYFIYTLIIKGIEGLFVCKMYHKTRNKLIIYIIASVWMVFGYFLAKWMLKGNVIVAFSSVLGNVAQGVVGVIVASLLNKRISEIAEKHKVNK